MGVSHDACKVAWNVRHNNMRMQQQYSVKSRLFPPFVLFTLLIPPEYNLRVGFESLPSRQYRSI